MQIEVRDSQHGIFASCAWCTKVLPNGQSSLDAAVAAVSSVPRSAQEFVFQETIIPQIALAIGVLAVLIIRALGQSGKTPENRGQLLCAGAVLRACRLRHSAAL